MTAVFVDSNLFLRLFTRDDRGQCERAAKLFRQAREGRVRLITGPPVTFEVAWTLRSHYRQSTATVLDVLEAMLATPGLELLDHDRTAAAIQLARTAGMDFADAYVAVSARDGGCEAVATFNRADFRKSGMTLLDL
jgi:predicted nucleic acid-binding protein